MDSGRVKVTEEALEAITRRYTREAGVRNLDRIVGGVVRYKDVQWTGVEAKSETYNPVVDPEDLEEILGPAPIGDEETQVGRSGDARGPGVVNGLSVSGSGEGAVMLVECAAIPGSGKLKLTGSLGEVIRESAEIAMSWVRGHASRLDIKAAGESVDIVNSRDCDVHLHLPSGAIRKDGPSAGVAITSAFISILTGVPVPADVAMTGEITLRGRVTAVGGVREKVLGAQRAGVRRVVLPWANRGDVREMIKAGDNLEGVGVHFAETIEEAVSLVFEGKVIVKGKGVETVSRGAVWVESRL